MISFNYLTIGGMVLTNITWKAQAIFAGLTLIIFLNFPHEHVENGSAPEDYNNVHPLIVLVYSLGSAVLLMAHFVLIYYIGTIANALIGPFVPWELKLSLLPLTVFIHWYSYREIISMGFIGEAEFTLNAIYVQIAYPLFTLAYSFATSALFVLVATAAHYVVYFAFNPCERFVAFMANLIFVCGALTIIFLVVAPTADPFWAGYKLGGGNYGALFELGNKLLNEGRCSHGAGAVPTQDLLHWLLG